MTVLLLGGYAFLGIVPEQKAIAKLIKEKQATELKLLKARIPHEPEENLDDILVQLEDQKSAIELIASEAENIESKLAPFDSQQLKVQISQLATSLGVRIKVTETFKTIPQKSTQPTTQQKKKNRNTVQTPVQSEAILPETMSWIARMSEGTMFYRPLTRYVIEGDFQKIQQFIFSLDDLPWQVTVLRINISKSAMPVPIGMAEYLDVDLVLAL
jgi:hypothetical protein